MCWVQRRWPLNTKGIEDKILWEINHGVSALSSCAYKLQTDEQLIRMLHAADSDSPEKVPPRSNDYEVFFEHGSHEYPILVQSRPLKINPHACQKCIDSKKRGFPSVWPVKDLDHDIVPWLAQDHVCSAECGVASYAELHKDS